MDLMALHDVQTQIDSLIEELMTAKLTLAGLSIGADDVSANSGARTTRQR
jgi:citrate lyase beta subunit